MSRSARRGLRRGWWLVAGALAAIGFLSGFLLALERQSLAERWLLAVVREAGLSDASLRVTRFDWGFLEVRELRAAGDSLAVARIEARFTVRSLLERRPVELLLRGVEFAGTPAALAGPLRAGGTLLGEGAELAPDRLEVESARLSLETPLGRVELTVSARGLRSRDSIFGGVVDAELRAGLVRGHTTLSGSVRGEELQATLDLELDASGSFSAGSLGAAGLNLEARMFRSAAGLELALRECADLQVDGLIFDGIVAFVSPLRACLGQADERLLLVSSDAGKGTLEGAFEIPPLRLDLELGDRVRAEGETPHLALSVTGNPTAPVLGISAQRGLLEVPDLELEFRDLAGSLSWSPGAGVEGTLRLQEILDVASPARLPRLSWVGRAERGEGGTRFEATLADDSRRLVLELSGLDPESGPGRAELRLHPLSLGPDGAELLRLLPGLGDAEASGTLAAQGSFGWGAAGFEGGVDLALREVDLASEWAFLERANAVLRLEGLSPPALPPGQLLSSARFDFGFELADGWVRFAALPEAGLVIEEGEWSFAGGTAAAAGALDGSNAAPLVLEVEEADLAELFGLLDLPELVGEGLLFGEIPLVRTEDGLSVRDARLDAGGDGRIRYQPSADEPDEVRAVLAPFADALADFRYEVLELALDGEVPGAVEVGLTLLGTSVEGGEPLEIHLELPGHLDPSSAPEAFEHEVPEEIESRLEAFAELD
ncbi:MAG: YdbH domain-containing protein [Myxococcota bacterium]